jgi:hypothetical protein
MILFAQKIKLDLWFNSLVSRREMTMSGDQGDLNYVLLGFISAFAWRDDGKPRTASMTAADTQASACRGRCPHSGQLCCRQTRQAKKEVVQSPTAKVNETEFSLYMGRGQKAGARAV